MKINGQNIQIVSGAKLADILFSNGYDKTKICVELNGNIIPKKNYESVIVKDEDSMEVVNFVGGG
ncbi:MAG: sulfur carrier protein ThiS [Candidatus Methanomethylophilaceae archaeon]|nr:sulfur carrier protein ThiS [Candidatus Methanomethylophilaceae archaeon]